MSKVILLMAAVMAVGAQAEPRQITVLGQTVMAETVEYFPDTEFVNDFVVSASIELPLARNNHIRADNLVYLDLFGGISLISSPEAQTITWNTADGRNVRLDCGKRQASPLTPPTARIIAFYPGGEYKQGCSALDLVKFGDLSVTGDLDVTTQFQLLFGQHVQNSKLHIGDEVVQLANGTSVALFPSGKPRFFTLAADQGFSVEHPQYGVLRFMQSPQQLVSTSLFENGQVELGICANAVDFADLNLRVPAGSGLQFNEKDSSLSGANLAQAVTVRIKHYSVSISSFSRSGEFFDVVTAEEFSFVNPDNQQSMEVPQGSVLHLTHDREIIGIRSPVTRPPTGL